MNNEHVNVMPRLLNALDIKNVGRFASTSTGSDEGGPTTYLATICYDHKRVLDEHVLIHRYVYQSDVELVCNACVQPIPFGWSYSCVYHNETSSRNDGPCKDYFLHSCCAYLPAVLNFPRKRHKTLTLSTCKAGGKKTSFNLFVCDSCNYTCNGFAYLSQTDDDTSLVLDIVCALMPTSIVHISHGAHHILQSKTYNQQLCSYCGLELKPDNSYICNNCRNFGIHPACALIPKSVVYPKFDPHPLSHWHNLEKEQSILCESIDSPRSSLGLLSVYEAIHAPLLVYARFQFFATRVAIAGRP
ncbi:Cysteine/Histidine-rich C1 domain family protein [Striga hermonthica]|uniref:Cysteine/Histidine-rich C1 domain family protein n=1 Tax=Striga hermonthica TaxID=68872 RepID=A0A9N7R678_STRHE|nr:Cysteine/Histidine-rich C1 domain family protein [Striga hermonthica]